MYGTRTCWACFWARRLRRRRALVLRTEPRFPRFGHSVSIASLIRSPGRCAQTAAAPFRCWRVEPTTNRPAISMLWTTVHDPHLPSPTQGFAMQQLAGHWVLSATRPLERSSGPKALEAEMPSPFASSSSALSAAEACGATLEAVLRSRNLKELFGSIQQGRYCDATAHRP